MVSTFFLSIPSFDLGSLLYIHFHIICNWLASLLVEYKMQFSFATLIGAAAVIFASPFARIEPRTVASLDPAATAQAQQRDNTATRAVSNAQIKVCSTCCIRLAILKAFRLPPANVFLLIPFLVTSVRIWLLFKLETVESRELDGMVRGNTFCPASSMSYVY